MNNHRNILLKQASFDLKCSKMLWQLGLCPRQLTTLSRSPNRRSPLIISHWLHFTSIKIKS